MSVDAYNRITEIVAMSNANTKVERARIGVDTLAVFTTAGTIEFVHDENKGWHMSSPRVSGAVCHYDQAKALYKLMLDLARGINIKPELRSRFGLTH